MEFTYIVDRQMFRIQLFRTKLMHYGQAQTSDDSPFTVSFAECSASAGEAAGWVEDFWMRLVDEPRLTPDFRALAQGALATVHHLRAQAD
jgi:hypothetical protein